MEMKGFGFPSYPWQIALCDCNMKWKYFYEMQSQIGRSSTSRVVASQGFFPGIFLPFGLSSRDNKNLFTFTRKSGDHDDWNDPCTPPIFRPILAGHLVRIFRTRIVLRNDELHLGLFCGCTPLPQRKRGCDQGRHPTFVILFTDSFRRVGRPVRLPKAAHDRILASWRRLFSHQPSNILRCGVRGLGRHGNRCRDFQTPHFGQHC